MRLIDADKVEERLILLQANCERKPSQLTGAIWGALEAVREFVKEQPTVEPVKRGHWVKGEYDWSESHCSVCLGYAHPIDVSCFSYCPHCGAKMDGDGNV